MPYRNIPSAVELCGVPPLTRIHILNGVTTEVTLICNYVVDEVTTSIHLTDEGYGNPVVAFNPEIPGLSAVATIDALVDNIIHCVFNAECPSAVDRDVVSDVSVLITRGEGADERTDCVLRGVLEVEDAPLPTT